MGHQLYRMIRDGAPASWSPLMRLVALTIADDARDPDGAQDGLPWSALPVQGHLNGRGKWRDGLTERTGLSARTVSRALTDLARAGYDMRQPAGVDRHGRPVFAMKGHAIRFTVPPLPPRSTPDLATFATQSTPDLATFNGQSTPDLVSKHARSGDPVSPMSPQEVQSPQSPEAEVPDGSLEVTHARPVNEQRSPMTRRETEAERMRQADALTAWLHQHPEAANAS